MLQWADKKKLTQLSLPENKPRSGWKVLHTGERGNIKKLENNSGWQKNSFPGGETTASGRQGVCVSVNNPHPASESATINESV